MEELHQRSPATRSYSQSQAKDLFEKAGFQNTQLFREFTLPIRECKRIDCYGGQF